MLLRSSLDIHLPLAILDVVPDPIIIKGSDMCYVWVNAAYEAMFGVDRNDVIGHRTQDIWPNDTIARILESEERVFATGTVDEIVEVIFAGKANERHVRIRKCRLDMPTGAQFLVGVVHDLSEVMKANADLQEAKSCLEKQAEHLRRLANHDSLTNCLNRRALDAQVAMMVPQGGAQGLLILDLDHFKRVNDKYGHAAGDRVLVQFAEIVRATIDKADLLARSGGEEFVVFQGETSRVELLDLAERIRMTVAATPVLFGGNLIPMTVSLGASWGLPGQKADFETLMRRADAALYEAKRAGRNQIQAALDPVTQTA